MATTRRSKRPIDKWTLYRLVCKRTGMRLAEAVYVGDIADAMFDLIGSSLHAGMEVRIAGFGVFRMDSVRTGTRKQELRPVFIPAENLPAASPLPDIPKRKRKKPIMIKGFDKDTSELNAFELEKMVPLFVEGFNNHKGKESRITSDEIIKAMKVRGYKVNGARVRKIVNHIRMNGLVPLLMADQKGYWISDNPKEVRDYIDSLKERIDAISKMRFSIVLQARKKWGQTERFE